MRDDTKGGKSHFCQQDGDELKTQSADCIIQGTSPETCAKDSKEKCWVKRHKTIPALAHYLKKEMNIQSQQEKVKP